MTFIHVSRYRDSRYRDLKNHDKIDSRGKTMHLSPINCTPLERRDQIHNKIFYNSGTHPWEIYEKTLSLDIERNP